MDFSWLSDVRDYARELFGFEERPPYEPYRVPVGAEAVGMERYLPWVMMGFLGVVLIVALRK